MMVCFRWPIYIFVFFLISRCVSIAQESQSLTFSESQITDAEKDTLVKKNPTGAMLRSIFVPGWGQFYNGKWFKGIVIAGAEIGLIANAIVLDQWADDAQSEDEYYFYIDNRNLSLWLLGAAILYSMADAYVDAHLFNFDESPELTFFISEQSEPLVGIKSSTLSVRLSFSL